MRIKLLIILLLPMMLLECQTAAWNMLSRKNSKLFPDADQVMLREVTSSVDFKFGYDPDLEMDYVYKAGIYPDKDIIAKSPEMKKILLKYDSKEIVAFYEKIVQLKENQIWKMNFYTKRKKWVDSTYIQKYPLPETELFLEVLEKNIIQIDTSYGSDIEKRKIEIKNQTAAKLKKEQIDKEKKDNKVMGYPDEYYEIQDY